jgi:hypothetical protein
MGLINLKSLLMLLIVLLQCLNNQKNKFTNFLIIVKLHFILFQ